MRTALHYPRTRFGGFSFQGKWGKVNAPRALILAIAVFFLSIHSINGQSRDKAKETRIEKQLEAIDPSLVSVFHSGTIEFDKDKYAVADSLYSIVYQGAPSFDPVLRRLGVAKVRQGKFPEGLALCEKAVALKRSSENLFNYAEILIEPRNGVKASPEDLDKANNLLLESQRQPGAADSDLQALLGQIALLRNDENGFRVAEKTLEKDFPDKMVTHYFAAILAANDERWRDATNEIETAGKMGLSKETVSGFLDSGVQSKASTEYYKLLFFWIVIVWALGLLLLYLFGIILSNATMSTIENRLLKNDSVTGGKGLRKIYSLLINLAGAYYYISLPIILVLLIVLVVAVFYLFVMLGRIPIQLMLLLAGGSLITIYGMIRSLMLKVNYEAPGKELKPEDAPGLFALTNQVAEKMGTRPIDEIRITPATDLAVYERGNWRAKAQDKAKRILILGTGVLKDFKQDDFRAVLAHEYGHFSHRDTAGGDVALRVRTDMHKYFHALYSSGQNRWWNLAFQFLRLYDFLFRRISHGSTRLQEVLADRVAAQTYGKCAFQNGLTHVIKRNLEFAAFATIELEEAKKAKRPLNNLYELTGSYTATMEEQFKEAMNRKTTDDDTHPGPTDRFRYISGLTDGSSLHPEALVSDLFSSWKGLTEEMTLDVQKRVQPD